MDMIERVGLAVERAFREGYFTTGSDGMTMTKHLGRAAIEAMREPTKAMLKAGSSRGYNYGIEEGENCGCTRDIYGVMIDAALSTSSEAKLSGPPLTP